MSRPLAGGGRGRFAPSPTGHLHLGSLLAALASYAWSTQWSVRIDDLDTPRVVPGSSESISRTLKACALTTEQTSLVFQSQRSEHYHTALRHLCQAGLLYACTCSRRQLGGNPVYPGHCRVNTLSADQLQQRLNQAPGTRFDSAVRARLDGMVHFEDMIQGPQTCDLPLDAGDVIVHRRDGIIAYPLAAAVDDSDGIDNVVRGADLLGSTAAQIALMQGIDRTIPAYAHLPVLVDKDSAKLGKQTAAPAITEPLEALHNVWSALGQAAIHADRTEDFIAGVRDTWQPERIPRVAAMSVTA